MDFFENIKKNRIEIIGFSAFWGVFCFLTYLFWGRQGHPIIDCGREAYIPSAILSGKILFKDILSLYGPFSYQFNAILYKFFGENLNTLYAAGAVNSFVILSSVYLIARNISGKAVSLIISFVIMTAFVFHSYISSYTFPYSFAITYALSAFLLSTLFCIRYIKTSKAEFIPLSFFFLGISLLSKIEYSLFLGILIIILAYKPIPLRYWGISILSLFSIPLISFSALFMQGLTISDFFTYLLFMKKYSSSNLVIYFYKNYTGFFPSTEKLIANLNIFIATAKGFFLSSLLIYPFLMIISNKYSNVLKIKFNFIFKIIVSCLFAVIFPFSLLKDNALDESFSWLPISTALIILILSINFLLNSDIFKNNKKNSIKKIGEIIKNISQKDKIFLLLAVIALLSALKSFFFVNLRIFGTFVLPLAILVNIIFLIDYIPFFLKFLDKKLWKINCIVILAIIGLFFSLKNLNFSMNQNTYPVVSERGKLYTIKEFGEPMQQAIDYAKTTPENSKILVIPEGLMVNFLANRPSDDWYYSLIPNYVETFGEENVVNDLSKSPPDYIFINNRDCSDYGFPLFGIDFGFRILNFIENNYKAEKEFGDYLKFRVYKKNQG